MIFPVIKYVDFLTLSRYKDSFTYLLSKLSCELFLLNNIYTKLNITDEQESDHMLYKDILLYTKYPSFIHIPKDTKGSVYGINKKKLLHLRIIVYSSK